MFAGTPEWSSSAIAAVWTEIARLVQLDDDEALVEAIDDLIDSDISWPAVPLSTLTFVFVAVWGYLLGRRPRSVRNLLLSFESLEMRAERENAAGVMDHVKVCCPHLQEVIDDDLNWTTHPIPGEDDPVS